MPPSSEQTGQKATGHAPGNASLGNLLELGKDKMTLAGRLTTGLEGG